MMNTKSKMNLLEKFEKQDRMIYKNGKYYFVFTNGEFELLNVHGADDLQRVYLSFTGKDLNPK